MNPDVMTIALTLSLYAGLVVSPGPGFALISRMALAGRRRDALAATAGFGVGATVYAVLTMSGLAFVVLEIDWLTRCVQLLGGAYLVWLGVDAWRREAASSDTADPTPARITNNARRAFTTGLLVDLSNPKGIAFFLSIYVVAVTPDTALWARITIVVGGFLLEIGWYSLVTLLLSRPRPRRVYRRYSRGIDRTIGCLLGLIGAHIVYEQIRSIIPAELVPDS